LLAENNQILKKMRKVAIWDFGLRIALMALFLGLPVLAYYYVIEPYYDTLKGAFHSIQEVSHVRGLEGMLPLHNQDLNN